MSEMKIDWTDLQLFLAVARGGGLAAAARLTGLSAPTLGRHMLRLERALGNTLFVRQPRGYALTLAGQALLQEARDVETRILGLERRNAGPDADLAIQVSAGTWMTWFLTSHIGDIAATGARLVFSAAEHHQSIARREATIGLRNSRPREPGLAARKSVRVAFAAYASPKARRGEQWLASTSVAASANWVRANRADRIRIEVTSPRSLLDLARQGAGHAVLPCFVGDRDGALVRTGPIIDELTHDQWLVVHAEDRALTPVRRCVDLISRLLRAHRAVFQGAEPRLS